MLSLATGLLTASVATKPNILLVVIDDLGFDDMGYRALTPEIMTPNADGFAKEGVILENYYVQPSCSPTRTTILSGRYPLRTGVNNFIPTGAPYGLSSKETTLANMLRGNGYKTAAIGKWHGGMYSYDMTPTFRGFESFYGFYNGGEDYFTHVAGDGGYDMRRDVGIKCGKNCSHIELEAEGNYSTILFSEEAVKVVDAHDTSSPLFLYLAYQAVHSPAEAPEYYIEPYKHIGGIRSIYAGMLSCMDEGLGNVTNAFKRKGMMDNTIMIFTADNGGPTETCAKQGSSNWPLRGSKCSIWEGGTRGSSFMWFGPTAGKLTNRGGNYTNLMHAADWMPTIAEAIDVKCDTCLKWDGVSHYQALTASGEAPRDNIYYGITDAQVGIHGPAMRVGCYKVILGDGGKPGGWHPPAEINELQEILVDVSFNLQNEPLPKNPNNTKLLFNVCEDPDEHTPLDHNVHNMGIINNITSRIIDIWNTGTPGCPNSSCEGYAPQTPKPCGHGAPIKINGKLVWEPWCETLTEE